MTMTIALAKSSSSRMMEEHRRRKKKRMREEYLVDSLDSGSAGATAKD